MSCAFEEDLTAYVDGELSALRERQLALHLGTCDECRPTEALLRKTVAGLGTLPAFEPSAQMRRAVLHRIDEAPSLAERFRAAVFPSFLMPALGLGAAAAVAVVLHSVSANRATSPLEPGQIELAANYELVTDYDVLGLDSPEDLEVVQHLQELEAEP
jgi:anti-sigma factor RsiW